MNSNLWRNATAPLAIRKYQRKRKSGRAIIAQNLKRHSLKKAKTNSAKRSHCIKE